MKYRPPKTHHYEKRKENRARCMRLAIIGGRIAERKKWPDFRIFAWPHNKAFMFRITENAN